MEPSRTARDYMSADPITLAPETDIHRAMRTLVESRISGAPVVAARGFHDRPPTEKDCFSFMFAATYHREQGGWVSEFMSREVETIEAETDIVEVAQVFLKSRYRRFPVMEDGRLVGIISRRDVLRAFQELW